MIQVRGVATSLVSSLSHNSGIYQYLPISNMHTARKLHDISLKSNYMQKRIEHNKRLCEEEQQFSFTCIPSASSIPGVIN
jgi:hypothetical protein